MTIMGRADASNARVLSVTEAAKLGVAGLVRSAEEGDDMLVARRGSPVACVVSMRRLEDLNELEATCVTWRSC